MNRPAIILLVEDDPSLAASLRGVIEDEGHQVLLASRAEQGFEIATRQRCDVVLTDLKLPGSSGLELVKRLHATKARLPIILMTAHGTTEIAIEATRHGAYDYVLKPFEMPDLLETIDKALASSRLTAQAVEIGKVVPGRDAIVGNSRAMQEIYKEIGRIAAKPVTVLVRGDTGTGKELIARAICQHSDRADQPFIALNCAAIPETLLESELFGHEKGAFTGAEARRIGRFEQAKGGTLFLDEIGDMSLNTQVKLLRVLQEGCIQRVGGKEVVPLDVRVIAATHRDLETAVTNGAFREDLFYRLNVVTIAVPPLSRRSEDIPELTRYFVGRYAADFGIENPSIHPDAIDFLAKQPWPGNVRELENVVRKALLRARGYTVGLVEVREALSDAHPKAAGEVTSLPKYIGELLSAALRGDIESAQGPLMETVERELYAQAIALAHGNQARAARWIGVSRLTMREKLTHFGLRPNQNQRD
jgi:nitrogen regulation protein NR(I)